MIPFRFIPALRRLHRLAALAAAAVMVGCAHRPQSPDRDDVGDAETGLAEAGDVEVRKAIRPDDPAEPPMPRSEINDLALYLAGLPGDPRSPLNRWRERPEWVNHATSLNQLWRRFNAQRRDPINSWGARELGGLRSARVLFYPFSGPDFLYANAFFPDASSIVLCGLESAEALPDPATLSDTELAAALDGLATALTSSLNFSFFITKDMRFDFGHTRFRGTLPVLLTFLARADERVISVEAIALAPGGNVVARGAGQDPGFRIRCAGGRTVYYFNTNLANGSFTAGGRFASFVRSLGPCVSFTKSASYLLHSPGFSNVREFMLDWTVAVLQDDSGIPITDFRADRWSIQCFGNYTGTIDLFKEYYQPALAEAHARGTSPLGFGIGYKHSQGQSAMLLARRRRFD